jgi:hypothetical protein
MGDVKRFVVKNAARFAVYDEIIIRAKNHQQRTSKRVEQDLGLKSIPMCIKN